MDLITSTVCKGVVTTDTPVLLNLVTNDNNLPQYGNTCVRCPLINTKLTMFIYIAGIHTFICLTSEIKENLKNSDNYMFCLTNETIKRMFKVIAIT